MLGLGAAIFACLLVTTGFAKLRRPGDTSRALAALGFPNRRWLGTLLGAIEITIGASVLLLASPIALLGQALIYTSFSAWIGFALVRKVPIASCGCLGTPDTPPYWGHLVLDISAAVASMAAALTITGPLLQGTGAENAVAALLIGIGTYLAWLVIGDGARLKGAYSA